MNQTKRSLNIFMYEVDHLFSELTKKDFVPSNGSFHTLEIKRKFYEKATQRGYHIIKDILNIEYFKDAKLMKEFFGGDDIYSRLHRKDNDLSTTVELLSGIFPTLEDKAQCWPKLSRIENLEYFFKDICSVKNHQYKINKGELFISEYLRVIEINDTNPHRKYRKFGKNKSQIKSDYLDSTRHLFITLKLDQNQYDEPKKALIKVIQKYNRLGVGDHGCIIVMDKKVI